MTREQFKEWVQETFPDNLARAIAENNLRDGLEKMADYVFESIDNVNPTVPTLAAAEALTALLSRSTIINVTSDESQGGVKASYLWDQDSLQEILLL